MRSYLSNDEYECSQALKQVFKEANGSGANEICDLFTCFQMGMLSSRNCMLCYARTMAEKNLSSGCES